MSITVTMDMEEYEELKRKADENNVVIDMECAELVKRLRDVLGDTKIKYSHLVTKMDEMDPYDGPKAYDKAEIVLEHDDMVTFAYIVRDMRIKEF